MDNSLLAVRDINHKYIVVERNKKMGTKEYKSPTLVELNETEMTEANGGVGFPVVVGVAAAALLVVAGYTTVVAATVVVANGIYAVNIASVVNVTSSNNKKKKKKK